MSSYLMVFTWGHGVKAEVKAQPLFPPSDVQPSLEALARGNGISGLTTLRGLVPENVDW